MKITVNSVSEHVIQSEVLREDERVLTVYHYNSEMCAGLVAPL